MSDKITTCSDSTNTHKHTRNDTTNTNPNTYTQTLTPPTNIFPLRQTLPLVILKKKKRAMIQRVCGRWFSSSRLDSLLEALTTLFRTFYLILSSVVNQIEWKDLPTFTSIGKAEGKAKHRVSWMFQLPFSGIVCIFIFYSYLFLNLYCFLCNFRQWVNQIIHCYSFGGNFRFFLTFYIYLFIYLSSAFMFIYLSVYLLAFQSYMYLFNMFLIYSVCRVLPLFLSLRNTTDIQTQKYNNITIH